jgi:uncharacterized Zn finger protein (UPF0148 family)
MGGRRKRQVDRPDYAEAMEPRCPECGEVLVISKGEYGCPRGHGDEAPLSEEGQRASSRERTGELGEDR